ncbi:hypothetical protein TrCOL_g5065, partial [Triparma columacea]
MAAESSTSMSASWSSFFVTIPLSKLLSEALARLHCDDEVKPAYVSEAFRLLKQSIIHVDTEDVTFEEDEVAAVDLCAIVVPIVGSLSLPVSELLQKHSSTIGSIRQGGGTYSDLFYLRHILEFGEEEAAAKVQDTIAWRNGAGSNVVKRAGDAVTMATADGGWNNEPVLEKAPHYTQIKPFITGKQILTTSTRDNDLIYCVR